MAKVTQRVGGEYSLTKVVVIQEPTANTGFFGFCFFFKPSMFRVPVTFQKISEWKGLQPSASLSTWCSSYPPLPYSSPR